MKKGLINSILFLMITMFVLVGCKKTPPTPPNPPTPPDPPIIDKDYDENLNNYFSNIVDYAYTNTIITDQNGSTAYSYNQLIDRELTMFADSIFVRLFSVYGLGFVNTDKVNDVRNEYVYYLIDPLTNEVFKYKNSEATVTSNSLICIPFYETSLDKQPKYMKNSNQINVGDYDLTSASTFARALFEGGQTFNNTIMSNFNFKNAINGGYVWDNELGKFTNQLNIADENEFEYKSNLAWKWNFETANILTEGKSIQLIYSEYKDYYFPRLKEAIANIFAYGTYINGKQLSTAISAINDLSLSDENRIEQITEYIFKEIIGDEAVGYDTTYLEGGFPNITILDNNSVTSLQSSHHNYKAYNIVIPAIVNSARNNTYLNSEKTIWLEKPRVQIGSNQNYGFKLVSQNYTKVVLTTNKEINLTKLTINFSDIISNNVTFTYTIKNSTLNYTSTEISATEKCIVTFNGVGVNSIPANTTIEFSFKNSNAFPFGITFANYYKKA